MGTEHAITEQLLQHIRQSHIRFEVNGSELEQWFHPRQLKKGDILLSFNTICRHYYFVNKGSLRVFFLNDGQEYTSWFAFENYFFTESESYARQTFSNYTIIAMEDTEIIEISKPNMDHLLSACEGWKDFLLFSQQQIIIKLTGAI